MQSRLPILSELGHLQSARVGQTRGCSFSRADRTHRGTVRLPLGGVYTGNVHDREGSSTWCPGCGELLIERDWYQLGAWNLDDGCCRWCGYRIVGVFEEDRGDWDARRIPVRLRAFA